jgi:flagellar FliJ protein
MILSSQHPLSEEVFRMAGSFKFKLQQVLDYRTQLEEQAKMEFARAQQQYRHQTALVEQLRRKLDIQLQQLYASPTMSQAERWLAHNYIQAIKQDIQAAEQRLLQIAQQLTRARQNLIQKAQERKLLDKLKSKQAERHDLEEKLKEQHTNDETATLRYQPPSF